MDLQVNREEFYHTELVKFVMHCWPLLTSEVEESLENTVNLNIITKYSLRLYHRVESIKVFVAGLLCCTALHHNRCFFFFLFFFFCFVNAAVARKQSKGDEERQGEYYYLSGEISDMAELHGYRLPSCIIHIQYLYLMHIMHLNLQYAWRIYTLEPEGTHSWNNVNI